MFSSTNEANDHAKLMQAIAEMPYADTPCQSYPEAFFEPDFDEPADYPARYKEIAIAQSLCAGCEARFACFEYAMKWNPKGIWGGSTEGYRKNLRADLNRKASK